MSHNADGEIGRHKGLKILKLRAGSNQHRHQIVVIDIKLSNVLLSRITGLFNTIFSSSNSDSFNTFHDNKIELLGYGQWSIVWIFIGIATFLDLGVSKQLVQNIAKSNNKGYRKFYFWG